MGQSGRALKIALRETLIKKALLISYIAVFKPMFGNFVLQKKPLNLCNSLRNVVVSPQWHLLRGAQCTASQQLRLLPLYHPPVPAGWPMGAQDVLRHNGPPVLR